jgi:glycosyltransferase involved in cell wall biosynthesis
MPSNRPLLTIAIPTYNRAKYLTDLLDSLADQLIGQTEIELLISDNASSDETPAVVREFEKKGLHLRSLRNGTNIGSDANFLQCFTEASGKYVWLLGDDEIVLPGSIGTIVSLIEKGDYALVYVSSYAFRRDFVAERKHDRFGRVAQVVNNGAAFIEPVGTMIAFISAMIANKSKYDMASRASLSSLIDSNLMHLGWLLPILEAPGDSLIIWEKLIAARAANSEGWGICKVFGNNLENLVRSRLQIRPEIASILINSTLRLWFPHMIMQMRRGLAGPLLTENIHEMLQPRFKGNWRYWVYIFPVAILPYPLARAWYLATQMQNRTTRFLSAIFTYPKWRKDMIWASR